MRPRTTNRARALFVLASALAASCATIVGIEDTTDEPALAPPETSPDGAAGDGAVVPGDEDSSTEEIDETPALEDAGTYADVEAIDAQVVTCAEPGLVARWRIDEGTGDVVSDCSGNALHGKATKATWTSNGADGGALLFGGDGWVGFANPAALRITGPLTVAGWFRADRQTSATEYLVGKSSNAGTNGWRLALIDATRQLAFATPSAGGAFNVVGGSMPIGSWKHLAAVFEPEVRTEVYVDGKRVGARGSNAPKALVTTSVEARIGARFDGLYGFKGAASDVRVYSRALTATEIADIAKR